MRLGMPGYQPKDTGQRIFKEAIEHVQGQSTDDTWRKLCGKDY